MDSFCFQVWNRRTNTAWAALTLTGHSGTVRCLHLHDNRLVSGSSDRTIKVNTLKYCIDINTWRGDFFNDGCSANKQMKNSREELMYRDGFTLDDYDYIRE